MLIHPIQWTIANPVGADRPTKRQKKTACVSTGRPVPVLCTRKVAHRTSFLSRQSDVIASFSFGACTVQTCFQQSPDILRKSVDYDRFSTLFANNLICWKRYLQGIFIRVFCLNIPSVSFQLQPRKKRQYLYL